MPSLGNDLASLRKQLNLNIEDIHHSIKIPVTILESIEDDSIFTAINENTTYIRSYVRSYAKALKIDDVEIVRALDQMEIGIYSGFLNPSGKSEKKSEPEGDSSAAKKVEKKTPQEKASEEGTGETLSSEPAPRINETEDPDEDDGQTGKQLVPPPPSVGSVDWADMGRKFTPLQAKSRMWIGLVFVILMIIAAAFYFLYQNYYPVDDSGSEIISGTLPVEVETPATDSLQLDLTAPANTSVNQIRTSSITPPDVLSDTLSMVIYAAYGVLEPVRVFSDVMEGLNLYWIEQGEAFRFNFVNQIHIHGQYSRMVLLLNGRVIENFRQRFYNPETGVVEINRSAFEDDPSWLQPSAGSPEVDASIPAIIKDHPTFNFE